MVFLGILNILMVCMMCTFVYYCPYTKVEESFNMQAIHDLIYHGKNISLYDHHEYPGPVPRTFIGPLSVVLFGFPVSRVYQFYALPKIYMQVTARVILGLFVIISFIQFQSALKKHCSPSAVNVATIFTISQFHFLFYSTRTLPNIFALVLVLYAVSSWLSKNNAEFIWFSAAAIIIFRSEVMIFMGLLLLVKLINEEIGFLELFLHCVMAGPFFLGLSVLIDSHMWQRFVWPEGEVFYYNTILNKSSNWGTSPFFWYFYSAIPRSLLCAIAFLPFGLYSRQQHQLSLLIMSSLTYVLIYSILPHKELRFIIYVIPILNVAAATGVNKIRHWFRKSSFFSFLLWCSVLGAVLLNLLLTVGFTMIASNNYPGGVAFERLHSLNEKRQNESISVHICNAAAQTGVTRFGEQFEHWIYSKNESFVYNKDVNNSALPYNYLLSEAPCSSSEYYNLQEVISGYTRFEIHKTYPFFSFMVIDPKICIMEKT